MNKNNDNNSNDALNSFIEKYGRVKDDHSKERILSLWEREQKIKTEETEILRKEVEYLKLELAKIKIAKNQFFQENKCRNVNKILTIVAVATGTSSLIAMLVILILLIVKVL